MRIKIKYMLLIALAALVSCSSDDFVGDQTVRESNENAAISFGFDVPQVTRASGATAATALGNQFIVWGEKNTGEADTKDAPTAGHLVFPNYQVNYTTNTAYTTTSNTKDWEYVGYTHSTNYQNNIKYQDVVTEPAVAAVVGSSAAQTIKYWDYSAGSYTFTAVAAANTTTPSVKHDIENGYITIQKNINNASSPYNKGYTIGVTAEADLTKLYFSDRTIITQSAGTDRNATNAYGGNVTLKFRNALSQVRAGVYETIPGYAISDIHFFVTSDVEAQVSSVDAFGAICPNIKGDGYAGDLTVTYSEETATLNQPVVSASGTVAADLILGTNTNTVTTSAPLGTTSASPTWDTAEGAFTTVMLQGAHTTNMKVKCNYTLYNSVSGETIVVEGATAEVPYQYLQWKPNYKYTYLFKISNNTNGSSGQGVVGLYPITFDAVEIAAEDGAAEYITIVNEPSITTFGVVVNSSDEFQAYQTDKNEYQVPSGSDKLDIYATFLQGGTVLIPQLTEATKANFVTAYVVDYREGATEAEKAEKPITELSVANAIEHTGGIITATKITSSNVSTYFALAPTPVASVPVEDGTTKTINALKLTDVKTAGKYAVEIVTYEAVTGLSEGNSLEGLYSLATDTYSSASGTYSSGTYYKQIKTYKVITVAAAPAP